MHSILDYPLKIGDLIASIPIVQGGMGVKISGPCLAAAVASEGGVGVIAAADIGMDEPDFFKDPPGANIRALEKAIRKARQMTDGIIGVNIMVALTDYAKMVAAAIEEGIDIIFSGAGLPMELPKFISKGSNTKVVPIVSSARAALLIAKNWLGKFGHLPDAVVVEGPKAGGHLGFKLENIENSDFALEKLVPEVVEAMEPFSQKYNQSIPVIAAGGIYTGADILKFLQLGASGVQMATRFVTTHECDANIKFKQAYIDAKQSDITIIQSPVGMPGRAIRNEFLEQVSQGKKMPINCPYLCLKTCKVEKSPYCISHALMNAYRGKFNRGFAFCGANAHRAEEIISVHELIESIKEEFENA